MTKTLLVLMTAGIAVSLLACMRDPYIAPAERDIPDLDREVFVINGLAETLSIIDPATLDIYNDVLVVGMWPNHILFHGGKLYITNSGDNSIRIYDETTFRELGEIYTGKGTNPWSVILKTGTDKAYVPTFAAGEVAVVDLATAAVDKRIAVGTGPEGGAFDPDRNKLYVCNTSWDYESFGFNEGTVSVIDGATDTVIRTISVEDGSYELGQGSNPQAAIALPDIDEIHIVCTGKNGGPDSDDGKIVIIDAITDTVKGTLPIGGSPLWSADAIDPDNRIVYLAGIGGVMSYYYGLGLGSGDPPVILHGSGSYIIAGSDLEHDLFSGVAVDTQNNLIFVCNYTGDRIIVLQRSEPYDTVEEIEGSDGAQTPYLVVE
ncbi:MAG TPA: YncE family protein [Spirochaetia bacterium]|nr:YncE family protein [Spirochaetia bacterium]